MRFVLSYSQFDLKKVSKKKKKPTQDLSLCPRKKFPKINSQFLCYFSTVPIKLSLNFK